MQTTTVSPISALSDEDFRLTASRSGASDSEIASKGYMWVAAESLLLQRNQLADLLDQLDTKLRAMHEESLPFDLRSVCERSRQLLDGIEAGPIPSNLT